MNRSHGKTHMSRAQTASELAIFGGIFIFVLGIMIRYATSFNFMQNQSLEAMRLAMRESFLSGESGNTSRIYATVLFIEDRKEAGNTKFGAMSRTPYIAQGSGIFTKNMYMGTDYGVSSNLPVMDMYINGQHFTFTTAGFKKIRLITEKPSADNCMACGSLDGELIQKCIPSECVWDELCGCRTPLLEGDMELSKVFLDLDTVIWDQDCVFEGESGGCAKALKRIVRGDPLWCQEGSCDDGFGADNRFNLDRDMIGTTDVEGQYRDLFSWQWYRVPLMTKHVSVRGGRNLSIDLDGDLKEEQILKFDTICEYEDTNQADYGYDDENEGRGSGCIESVMQTAFVLDSQEGDLDLTYNSYDQQVFGIPSPGLFGQATMLTFTKSSDGEGTLLRLEEGKLYGTGPDADKQFTRQTQKQDRIDIIERKIQLSNDTKRMYNCIEPPGNDGCDNPAVEVACGDYLYDDASLYTVGGDLIPYKVMEKKLERFRNCTSGKHQTCCYEEVAGDNYGLKTCFDKDCLVLYVRSRIKDTRGRRWITNLSEDEEN